MKSSESVNPFIEKHKKLLMNLCSLQEDQKLPKLEKETKDPTLFG